MSFRPLYLPLAFALKAARLALARPSTVGPGCHGRPGKMAPDLMNSATSATRPIAKTRSHMPRSLMWGGNL